MELTVNTHNFQFSDYLKLHDKPSKKTGLLMKRSRVKRSNKLLRFNKWFAREHAYCLPINKKSEVKNDISEEVNGIEEFSNKTFETGNSISLDNSESTDLEEIDVNELLKDALLENQKNQINDVQTTTTSKDSNSSDSCSISSVLNESCFNKNDLSLRLSNENINIHASDDKKEKVCASIESTPSTLFLPMDIDNDMIKLFPTLDFSTEHNLNEKPENTECKVMDTMKNILPENTEKNSHQKDILCNESTETISKLSQPLQIENCVKSKCKTDHVCHKPQNNSLKLSAVASPNIKNPKLASEQYINIFNRYQEKPKEQFIEQVENPGPILLRDLLCGSKPKTIISPYTHRHLKPYIFRDPVTKPLWLRMLSELKDYFRKKRGLPKSKEVETIDYSYVRVKHIQSVNSLATQFFWPGIDLTESLLYPDFSVIALYKNLVIGFGFMVPDISTNENYITFLFTRPHWTNCGIAKFMIYHLIQTCMTRDITLHVSPNNPAMILYQKFGFKIEEFVQHFYENYIPAESNLSKHAFFLRLRSTLSSK